ncbi:NifB/NifX family molybdenum-iron cluster-binding protein [Treponema sp. C6A8]|uniref:NifB/NifX family molybdenum-iron cluster-binding protein n=1 Tax=Treponema sp. C6A8 TaxID=1410609 RepID=UPI0006868F2A|nr:NifB/NifX family molybdenum-iron cluster-binding protein [Treponema sp. C6A8]
MADKEKTVETSPSKYRIAVASTDGDSVNIHYGKSNLFYIYYVDDETGYDLVEKRSVTPVCQDGSHLRSAMEESVKLFEDCKYVVASRIGPGAAQALTSAGLISMELPGSIDDAILKVWKYNRVQGLFN